MNPLSSFTYFRRHWRQTLMLLSLVTMATAGLYMMVTLSWEIFIEPMRSNYSFLSKFSILLPDPYESQPYAPLVARIQANPDVASVIPIYSVQISIPQALGGGTDWFSLLGLKEEDLSAVLSRSGATLKTGRMLHPRTNEVVLSEEVAVNLGLEIGDLIHNVTNPELYGNIVTPMKVVGILDGDISLGIISFEYLDNHEVYNQWPLHMLVVPHERCESIVDDFLQTEVRMAGSGVLTFDGITEQINNDYQASTAVLIPIIAVVTVVITLVSSIINRIAFTRRVLEFGVLYASGYSKMRLTSRLTMESGVPAIIGWVIGICFSWLVLYIINLTVFLPRGHDLNLTSLAPVVLTTPVPLAIIGYTLISFRRTLSRLDPVSVVERGELSLEEKQIHATRVTSINGSLKPLAPSTYIKRHKRRAVLQAGAMALMILAVVFVIFSLSAADDAQRASLVYLNRVSRIHARPGASLHPSVVTQVKAHPSVERVIQVGPRYGILSVFIPPIGNGGNASPFAVYTQDLAYLVDLYDLEVKDGHLPRPNTNEIIIPEVVAQNRELKVGDVIGDPDHPAYPGASPLPTEFVVSGIFARPPKPKEENWLAFISLEFMESHEVFQMPDVYPLIAVPKDGQKNAMDNWLENELASDEVWVLTYRQETAQKESRSRNLILTIALVESAIAIVAAIALAVLNYFSVSERQAEFGVLHAFGYSRLRLIGKTVRETAFTTGAAWGLSIILCLIGLLYIQFGVFTSLGLELNLFNTTPWLFTLPIPIAVLVATSITISRVLSKLDPISIIERRS